jgi:hypothetical protein
VGNKRRIYKPRKMNYITRTIGNITLYYDGEKFQEHQSKAAKYDSDEEAQQDIDSNDLQYAEIAPIPYNGVWQMLTSPFKITDRLS